MTIARKTPLPTMLRVKEVSQLLHMHDNTVRRWGEQGIIQTFPINYRGDRRFRSDDVYRIRDELLIDRSHILQI
jgi:DNA-binding transcriptional MerR regulator